MCNGTNPRILQQFYVDPPECVCRACPSNWTSSGGIPSRTACRPVVIPQYFLLEIEVATSNPSPRSFNLTGQNDVTSLRSGRKIIDQIIQRLSAKGQHLGIKLHGPVLRRNIGESTSIFSSIHTFNSVWQEEQRDVTLLDVVKDNCFDLSSAAACQQCQGAIGVDLCAAARSVAGRDDITFTSFRMALKYLDVPPGNLKPLRVSAKESHGRRGMLGWKSHHASSVIMSHHLISSSLFLHVDHRTLSNTIPSCLLPLSRPVVVRQDGQISSQITTPILLPLLVAASWGTLQLQHDDHVE